MKHWEQIVLALLVIAALSIGVCAKPGVCKDIWADSSRYFR